MSGLSPDGWQITCYRNSIMRYQAEFVCHLTTSRSIQQHSMHFASLHSASTSTFLFLEPARRLLPQQLLRRGQSERTPALRRHVRRNGSQKRTAAKHRNHPRPAFPPGRTLQDPSGPRTVSTAIRRRRRGRTAFPLPRRRPRRWGGNRAGPPRLKSELRAALGPRALRITPSPHAIPPLALRERPVPGGPGSGRRIPPKCGCRATRGPAGLTAGSGASCILPKLQARPAR